MDLVPYMYFEQQEPGSQLNNLLQQNTYTEFDLAEIAQRLDQAENATLSLSNQNKKSYNLDDTGFFSISVLERALQVWDLTLVRWRGEAMKPYQEHPEDQTAFILNLSQHWLPLRRFSPDPPHTSATKRWYNLNSFLPNGPEWISPTYLRLVLTQAEEEGYSVFVVRRAGGGPEGMDMDMDEGAGWGDGGVGVLPECLADRMAVELGEPVGRTGAAGVPGTLTSATGVGPSQTSAAGLSNPDQPTVDPSTSPPLVPSSPPTDSSRRRRRQEDLLSSHPSDDYAPSRPPRPPRSERRPRPPSTGLEEGDEDEDEAEELDEDVFAPVGGMDIRGSGAGAGAHEEYGGPMDFAFQSRSYDDEDAALQAALKASMDDLPPGWVAPVFEENPVARKPSQSDRVSPPVTSTSTSAPAPAAVAPPGLSAQNRDEEIEEDDEVDEPQVEELSPVL
ncbi:hypothetical protein EHS25_009192 [Saitozyma podzolica]|uniref:Ataxin-3 homolog n=1 Tax=Saitozyma podzolica TaxID=1890683 RepID=A0A427YL34_9TREE|nr:hypothetical protein EHS25_009192 [Saitozyma podzolica]